MKLVEGAEYRIIGNRSGHDFEIGEIVRYAYDDDDTDLNLVCYKLDESDFWYVNIDELEEV